MEAVGSAWRKSTNSGTSGGDCVEVATWRKSTYSGTSGGNCVEVATWRKSTRSGTESTACVEAGVAEPGRVLVRDTTDRAGAVLAVPANAWRTFTSTIK